MKLLTTTKREYTAATLIIAAIGIFMVMASGSLLSGFHLMDGFLYIEINEAWQNGNFMQLLIQKIVSDFGVRFRPLSHISFFARGMIFGDNLIWQGIWQFLQCMIAALLLYCVGRRIRWSHAESLLLAGFTLVGMQSTVFSQTGTVEPLGIIGVAASWLFLLSYMKHEKTWRGKLSYAAFVVCTIFYALLKENFILILPAAYIFYCMQCFPNTACTKQNVIQMLRNTKNTGIMLAVFFVVFLGITTAISRVSSGTAYTSIQLGSIFPYLKAAALLLAANCYALLAVVAAIVFLRKTMLREWLLPILFTLAIILPQIFIYAQLGMTHRYMLPATLGCAYFCIYVWRMLKQNSTINLHTLCWKIIFIVMGIAAILVGINFMLNNPMQDAAVRFVVNMQGSQWQPRTSPASVACLRATMTTVAASVVLAGVIALLYGLFSFRKPLRAAALYFRYILMIFVVLAGMAYASHEQYALRGHTVEDFLHCILKNSHAGDRILIVGANSEGDGQHGAPLWLRQRGRENVYNCHIRADTTASWASFSHYSNRLDSIDMENIPVIAMFPALEQRFAEHESWFSVEKYDRREFFGGYLVFVKKQ